MNNHTTHHTTLASQTHNDLTSATATHRHAREARKPPHTPRKADNVDNNQLKNYWTKNPNGLAKWATKPHPWTTLKNHLLKYMTEEMAKRTAAQWFHDVFHMWPGERRGSNPTGPG